MSKEYEFNDLCQDLKHKLPSNIHVTKEGKNFLWIATKNYDIGSYPMHYEIRKEKNRLYVEIHYESEQLISLTGKYSDLSKIFQQYCNSKGLIKVQNTTPFYHWYRINDSYIKFKEGCVDSILSSLITLIMLTRDDLINLL